MFETTVMNGAVNIGQLGAINICAYLRMTAINETVVKLDLPQLREMLSLLRRTGNSTGQIVKYGLDLWPLQLANERFCPPLFVLKAHFSSGCISKQ